MIPLIKDRRARTLLSFIGVLFVFLTLRTYELDSVPVFLDEAIHIDFAKHALEGDWKVGLDLGKWLSIQTWALFLSHFTSEWPYVRLLSVAAGAGTLLLLMMTGAATASARLGLLSALSYAVLPFAVFYDRLVLTDQFQTLLLASTIFLSVRISDRSNRWDQAALVLALILAPLFKFSGFLFGCLPLPLVLLLSAQPSLVKRVLKVAPCYGAYLLFAGLFISRIAPRSGREQVRGRAVGH